MMKFAINPRRNPAAAYPPLAAMPAAPLAVHRLFPTYAPTPLRDAPELARLLGVARVSVKDESARFGLPSFKVLGASYATYRAFAARLGLAHPAWDSLAAWRAALAPLGPWTLATATDGNHGRAVAWLARTLGIAARIFVPGGTAPARIAAIAGEGAEVIEIDGSYDDAVARAAAEAGDRCLVLSDTAWPGYEDVPGWVIDGYATMLQEIDADLAAPHPDVVAVQIGVGALAAAVVRHYRKAGRTPGPWIVGVEPTDAACVYESIAAGRMLSLPGAQHSVMAGLNCGTPSPIAWPAMAEGIDAYVAVEDSWAAEAVRALAAGGIVSGESGAAGLAGLLALVRSGIAGRDPAIPLRPDAHVLVISTEGATDPAAYAQSLGTGA